MTLPPAPTTVIHKRTGCIASEDTGEAGDCERQAQTLRNLQELLRMAQEMLCDLQQQIDDNR